MDRKTVEANAMAALSPIIPANESTKAPNNLLFGARRTDAGRSLPEYYLIYFLLVDLLGFKNLGQFEKVAWSVPIDYRGQAFLVEHRKFGLGIFAEDLERDEEPAREIARLLKNATVVAEPYFEWLADQAADGSKLNVTNRARELLERHDYFINQYHAKISEAVQRRDECTIAKTRYGSIHSYPAFQLGNEANWLALAAIETFFSWTEHVFIHIGILRGQLLTGRAVRRAANANWTEKFDLALDRSDPSTKSLFDELIVVRQQLRNFDAHGSFGKNREAFSFHSSVGAVPLRLPHQRDAGSMKFGSGVDFVDAEAIKLIERFRAHLWSGARRPAEIYVQQSGLPLVLSYATDGTYAKAMVSDSEMSSLCDHLNDVADRYGNMDF